MSIDPETSRAGTSRRRQGSPPGLARTAVVVGVVGAALFVLGVVVFAVGYAVGGEEGTSDTWVGGVSVLAGLGGVVTAFLAFVTAVVARLRRESAPALWLPLTTFPALLALVVLGELFWWE